MSEPSFLTFAEVLVLHERSIARYGGTRGLRDQGGLESAVEQPKNTFYYGNGDLFDIGAAYAFTSRRRRRVSTETNARRLVRHSLSCTTTASARDSMSGRSIAR